MNFLRWINPNLLDKLQQLVGFLEFLQHLLNGDDTEHFLVLQGLLHDVLPVLVHCGEAPSLLWHLGHDIGGAEDGLQIEPGGLDLQPFIQNILEEH